MDYEEVLEGINDWSIEKLEELLGYIEDFIDSLKSESGGRDV